MKKIISLSIMALITLSTQSLLPMQSITTSQYYGFPLGTIDDVDFKKHDRRSREIAEGKRAYTARIKVEFQEKFPQMISGKKGPAAQLAAQLVRALQIKIPLQTMTGEIQEEMDYYIATKMLEAIDLADQFDHGIHIPPKIMQSLQGQIDFRNSELARIERETKY